VDIGSQRASIRSLALKFLHALMARSNAARAIILNG
jgi:hypothetical protein